MEEEHVLMEKGLKYYNISPNMSRSEIRQGFKLLKEKISTSTLGRHLGYYKKLPRGP